MARDGTKKSQILARNRNLIFFSIFSIMPRNSSTGEPKTKKRKTQKENKRQPKCWNEASALKFCFIRTGSSTNGSFKCAFCTKVFIYNHRRKKDVRTHSLKRHRNNKHVTKKEKFVSWYQELEKTRTPTIEECRAKIRDLNHTSNIVVIGEQDVVISRNIFE